MIKILETFSRNIQNIMPVFLISIIFYIVRKILLVYIYINNFSCKKLFDKTYRITYKSITNKKNILIVCGGGMIIDDCSDIILAKLLLPKLLDYNIITIKYTLYNKYSSAIDEIINALTKLNIDIFIANSFGAALLLDSLRYFDNNYKNKKMILISPMINFDLIPNQNKNRDVLNYYLLKNIINTFIDRPIKINFNNLPKSLIICSSDEIFYNDIVNSYNKLNNSSLHVLNNCTHSDIIIYGLFNKQSTKNTINKIINFIK